MVAPRVTSATAVDGSTVDVLFDQAMLQNASFYTVGNYVLTGGHTVSAVASPATNTARLTVTPEMFDGEALQVTVNAALQNAIGEAMDGAFLSDAFVGVGTAPQVSAASTPSATTIRVTFNESMAPDSNLVDPDNYTITPGLGGSAVVIGSVTPEAVANPTYVDLNLLTEMTNGVTYTVTVANTVEDAVGNALDGTADTVNVVGLGVRPQVDSAVVRPDGRVRITFDEPMRRGAALASIGNYLFTPISVGAATLFFSEVIVPAEPANPSYVDVVVSEMTDGATYEVMVANVTDVAGNVIDPANDTASFTGVGAAPTVQSVIAVGLNRVDVVFSERMRDTPDLRDPTNYTFDNGLTVLEVLGFSDDTVQLVTSDQTPGLLYTLTVNV